MTILENLQTLGFIYDKKILNIKIDKILSEFKIWDNFFDSRT